jgi:SAUR family protein
LHIELLVKVFAFELVLKNMDIVKEKWKKNLIVKTWERCKSIGGGGGGNNNNNAFMTKSKSWHANTKPSHQDEGYHKKKCKVAPGGCFSVYVGPQKQRFVIKTKFANHPLFKMLLEDAELEYGFNSQGPILLPCEVDLFYKVLAEMDSGDEVRLGCNFASPARRSNSISDNKNYGGYRLLTPSRMLKMNQL